MPIIVSGTAIPFSFILWNSDFDSRENEASFSALLFQTSHTHLANLLNHPLHRRSEIAAGPDGHPAWVVSKGEPGQTGFGTNRTYPTPVIPRPFQNPGGDFLRYPTATSSSGITITDFILGVHVLHFGTDKLAWHGCGVLHRCFEIQNIFYCAFLRNQLGLFRWKQKGNIPKIPTPTTPQKFPHTLIGLLQ